MNGVSKLTAYIIATRDDLVTAYGGPVSTPEGPKYVGWITLGEADRYRPLFDTGPVFDSGPEAKERMDLYIKEIRKAVREETGGVHPIAHVFREVEKDMKEKQDPVTKIMRL